MQSSARQQIVDAILAAGAERVGIARCGDVDQEAFACYERWITEGCHGGMDYLERHASLRRNPATLLEGCRSVLVAAFNYYHPERPEHLRIAMYAHGEDYHKTLRRRLKPVTRLIRENFGAQSRICIDTAPVMERYWAQQAGVGFIGRNGMLIVPERGSYFFLAIILTTLDLEPDEPCALNCGSCMKCVRACPGKALRGDSTLDGRRCHSYLTIEHRGPFPEPQTTEFSSTRPDEAISKTADLPFYGCDRCQEVCPHNLDARTTQLSEFRLREALRTLTREEVLALTPEAYAALTASSAMSRAPLDSLLRNIGK